MTLQSRNETKEAKNEMERNETTPASVTRVTFA